MESNDHFKSCAQHVHANDVMDDVIDEHMVGMINFDEHMAMTSPIM